MNFEVEGREGEVVVVVGVVVCSTRVDDVGVS